MENKAPLIKFIDAIEVLSKSKSLRNGDVKQSLKEILKLATEALGCQRANAWVFNEDLTVLESLLSYVKEGNVYSVELPLNRKDLPEYFKGLVKNEIIVSDDAVNEELNEELVEVYLNPNEIKSMIDIPIRSEGNMIGVVCFEQTNKYRKWTDEDMKFAQSLAQLISIALETNKKKKYRLELESLVRQKDVLISEINHRVKNNISVILGLVNLQQLKSNDDFHKGLFNELKDKIFSMSAVQNQLLLSQEVDRINLGDFLSSLLSNLSNSYDKEEIFIDLTKGVPLGLIANEIITNSYKYAFGHTNDSPQINVKCFRVGNEIFVCFEDNGPGFNLTSENIGMGLGIVKDLCDQIDGNIDFANKKGASITLSFQVT